MRISTVFLSAPLTREALKPFRLGLIGLVTLACTSTVLAAPPLPGAVFTTDQNGALVNGNIYAAKTDVYLNGGPPAQAPCNAAGLPNGDYYFQVTDPSGQTLLSTDAIGERKVRIAGGLIAAYLGTTHVLGSGKCPGAISVALMPYNNTPNPGGEYKAWLTPVDDYQPGKGKNGFIPRKSKTDNFKVKPPTPPKITSVCDVEICAPVDACSVTEGVDFGYPIPMVTGGTAPYTFAYNPPKGSAFPLGFSVVTVTVTDKNGLQGTSKFSVTVFDCQPPKITCPPNVTTTSGAGACDSDGEIEVGMATATDNCDGPVDIVGVRSDGEALDAPYPLGVTVITWTATDAQGNKALCQQGVFVGPGSGGGTQGTDPGKCYATLDPGTPVISDNCPNPTVAGVRSDGKPLTDPYPVGLTIIAWTVTDAAGNQVDCEQKIKVSDLEPPTIICPDNIETDTDPGECAATVDPGEPVVDDNCPGVTFKGVRSDGKALTDPYPVGTTLIMWVATDASCNQAACEQLIEVIDTEKPTITCPADIAADTDPGECFATLNPGIPTVADNCPDVTFAGVRSDGKGLAELYPVGTTTITWAATDAMGNQASCDQTITVADNEKPTITCPADIAANNDAGECFATVNPGEPTVADDCPGVTFAGVRSDGKGLTEPYPVGTTTITWTATDAAGNKASCDQTITVTDNEKPTITCPADIVSDNDPDECFATLDPGAPTVADNCPDVTFAGVRSDGLALTAPYPVGVTTITWTATDAAGNQASCDQKVTVKDTELPKITCPPDIL